jgi:microcystin-dependent protein
MADTATPLIDLVDQETGNNNNTWGDIADANFLKIENAIAGTSAIVTTGGTTILTADQQRPYIMIVSGTLTSNAILTALARSKSWIVINNTAGAFSVTLGCAGGGTSYIVPRGRAIEVACDGTNILPVEGAGGIPIGGTLYHNGTTVPDSYLLEDGSAVSRSTYAKLFAQISTTWGVGDGTTTFNLPNSGGRYLRGKDGTHAVGTYLAQDVQSHTHTASSSSDGAHSHTATTSSDGSHNHTGTSDIALNHQHTFTTTSVGNHTHAGSITDAQGAHTHSVPQGGGGIAVASGAFGTATDQSGQTTGSGGSHQHNVSLAADGTHNHTGTSDAAGTHQHVLTISTVAAHSHTLTTTTQAAHAHTITVNATGGTETRPATIVKLACIRFQ